jgi:hypothetical protein
MDIGCTYPWGQPSRPSLSAGGVGLEPTMAWSQSPGRDAVTHPPKVPRE